MLRIVAVSSLLAAGSLMAQVNAAVILPSAAQITAAVLPAPEEFRAGATVLGYDANKKMVVLQRGKGPLICLAPDPAVAQFHVACYHKSLEAFMARGRELRANGVKGPAVDSARFREIRRGKLKMPTMPAVLYTLTGPPGSFDPAKGTATGTRPLFVIYVPNATGASLGISEKPAENSPWVMSPGTPRAHIMFVPRM
jgi:hypothetical protein